MSTVGVTVGCWHRTTDGRGRFTPTYSPWYKYWSKDAAPAVIEEGVCYEIVNGERRRVGVVIDPAATADPSRSDATRPSAR